MKKKVEDKKLYALQVMGSTVLLLEPNGGTGIMASFKVRQVGSKFVGVANPGDLVHFIELPAAALERFK